MENVVNTRISNFLERGIPGLSTLYIYMLRLEVQRILLMSRVQHISREVHSTTCYRIRLHEHRI